MRRRPSLTRYLWTAVGVIFGALLGAEFALDIMGWKHGYLFILLTTIVGGLLGLWRDLYLAREWRHFESPEDRPKKDWRA